MTKSAFHFAKIRVEGTAGQRLSKTSYKMAHLT